MLNAASGRAAVTAPPVEVAIQSIAAGGDGVGRAGGLVVFVPRSAPGDVVTVHADAAGRRFVRADLESLRVPSPLRVEPPCPHYTRDRCGGCQLQHVRYDAQLEAKGGIIESALRRIARRELSAPVVRRSPAEWRYRRKLILALRRRGHAWTAGLHPYDAPERVFPLRDCPITGEDVMAVWRAVLAAADTLPAEPALRGAVRLEGEQASFTLEGGTHWPGSRALFERVPALHAIWWRPAHGGRRLLHRRGAPGMPGAAFAQVNAGVARLLHEAVLARALAPRPATLVDAYAGTGELALAAAEQGVQVTAIELDADAAAWSAARLPHGSRSVAGRVEEALAAALPADVVVLNPPRAGLDARVPVLLERARPRPARLLYVSCDPATLARDLGRLPGYRVVHLEAFDMFPQTAHVETLCELAPEGG